MSVVTRLDVAADPSSGWTSGLTPAISYSTLDLIDTKPVTEQIAIYHSDDGTRTYPLTYTVNTVAKAIHINETQPGLGFHGDKYDPNTDGVMIYRSTQIDASYVLYQDGARLTASTLNLSVEQIMHLLQEITNRLNETVHWEVLPDFTCLLTAALQCDVTQHSTDIATLFATTATHTTQIGSEFSYTATSDLLNEAGGSLSTVASVYDHSRAQHQFTQQLRHDVNWLLCQSPAYDGDSVDSVVVTAPVDSAGNTYSSGVKYVKVVYIMTSLKTHTIIYAQPEHIIDVTSIDNDDTFQLKFWMSDSTYETTANISKLAGPAGPTGDMGPIGKTGNGFWIWGEGSLQELETMTQPNPNMFEEGQKEAICYFVTSDATYVTNPHKGDAGHIFEHLSPTFKNPNDPYWGAGDYTGYLLRFERDSGGTYAWHSTNTRMPLGMMYTPGPLRWEYDVTTLIPSHLPSEKSFATNMADQDFSTVTWMRLNKTDASGSNVGALLWSLVEPFNRPQTRARIVMHSERDPSFSASFSVTSATNNANNIDLTVEILHVNGSDFPFFDPAGINTADRICFNIYRSGDNFFDSLNDLQDVTIASPVGGHVLQYDAGDSQWKNSAYASAIFEIEHNFDIYELDSSGGHEPMTFEATHTDGGTAGRDYPQSIIKIPDVWTHFGIKSLTVTFDAAFTRGVGFDYTYPEVQVWYANAEMIRAKDFQWYNFITSKFDDGWDRADYDLMKSELVYQLDTRKVDDGYTVKVGAGTPGTTTADSNIVNTPNNGSVTNAATDSTPYNMDGSGSNPSSSIKGELNENGSIWIRILGDTQGPNWTKVPMFASVNLVLYGDTL